MNSLLKNLLGLVLIGSLGVASFVLFQVSKTYDRSSEPTNFRSFTVSGDGKSSGTPDVAEFSFYVITEGGADVAKLQSDNATKMNKALEFIKKQGVAAKDIKTEQYSISPRYQTTACDYSSGKVCPPPEITGYTVQQGASVKIRDFKLISELLKGVVQNGANSVSQISFALDNPTEVENAARAEAFKKAKEKAEALAKAGGFSLGRLLDISEGMTSPVYYGRGGGVMMDMAKSEAPAVAPSIEAGSQEVTITVSLKYEIQ